MKRLTALILTAALLLTPALAAGPADPSPATEELPFTDVAADAWYADAVALCYETGLLKGRTETTFDPQGTLTAAELVVLAARLYDVCGGGSGALPDLPDLTQPYLRFYSADGTLLGSYALDDAYTFNAAGEGIYIRLSDTPDDPALPETCEAAVGFEGYADVLRCPAVLESHFAQPGAMSQGLSGTGYRIADPDAARRILCLAGLEADALYCWWSPAVFYLVSRGLLSFSGDLLFRLDPDGQARADLSALLSRSADRALAAWLMDLAAGEQPLLNGEAAIPDVDPEETADAAAILRMYRAGILTGVDDSGRFDAGGALTRGQTAVILARVLDPDQRVAPAQP